MLMATSIPTALLANPRARDIVQSGSQQVLQATTDPRWQHAAKYLLRDGLINTWQEIVAVAESVLLTPQAQNIVRAGETSVVAIASRIPIGGISTWVSVSVYLEGPFVGQVASVIVPTTWELQQAGVGWAWWF